MTRAYNEPCATVYGSLMCCMPSQVLQALVLQQSLVQPLQLTFLQVIEPKSANDLLQMLQLHVLSDAHATHLWLRLDEGSIEAYSPFIEV